MNIYNKLYKHRFILFSLLITAVFMYPYLSNTLNYEHDTFFHLSRIEGLAKSFSNGDLLPNIYFDKNTLYGYGSPMFYSDFFLIIPALLYNLGVPLVICYKLLLTACTFISCLFVLNLMNKFTRYDSSKYIAIALYIFCTYRMTNVFVRGALGEVLAYTLMPLILLAIYEVLYEHKWFKLTIGFSCLILIHNISFILACLLFLILLAINYKRWLNDRNIMLNILKAIALTIGLTAFFTVPMIEQLLSQPFNINLVNNSYLLENSSLHIYQFLQNALHFNVSKQDPSGMIVNIGLLLTFLPLAYLFIKVKENDNKAKFIKQCMFVGYIVLIIQSSAIPWGSLTIFSFMQFTWRLMSLAALLLLLPASIYPMQLFEHKKGLVSLLIIIVCICNSALLLQPATARTNVIDNDTDYTSLINGDTIDPYYSAFYVRVELAGGDYLPSSSVDFQERDYGIYSTDSELRIAQPIADYDTLSFSLSSPFTTIVLPKTYYKGYQVYYVENDELVSLETFSDPTTKLVSFNTDSTTGDYILVYEKTPLNKIAIGITFMTIIFGLWKFIKQRQAINQ